MSLCKARLPDEYVLAFPDDPAIDWDATAEKWEIKPAEDAEDPAAARRTAARLHYAERGPDTALPLAASGDDLITRFVCRPLTHKENVDLHRRLDELRGEDDTIKTADFYEFNVEALEVLLVRVDDFGGEYRGLDDLPQDVIIAVGSRAFALNNLSVQTRDF